MSNAPRTRLGLLILVLAALACQPTPTDEVRLQGAQTAGEPDLVAAITAERDSMFNEVAENARLMNEIQMELSRIEGLEEVDPSMLESPLDAPRANLLHKLRQVTTRLQASEQRLAANQRRLRAASTESEELKTRVAQLEQNAADFQALIESQKTALAGLTAQLDTLRTTNVALRDTIAAATEVANTVYYVVGTEEELLARGLIEKQGGSRVLFIFGKRGETLVPGTNLDPTAFQAINKLEVTEIPLPNPEQEYRIATRQNVQYLISPLDEGGNIKGRLQIGSPQEFWLPSKFLILVET